MIVALTVKKSQNKKSIFFQDIALKIEDYDDFSGGELQTEHCDRVIGLVRQNKLDGFFS